MIFRCSERSGRARAQRAHPSSHHSWVGQVLQVDKILILSRLCIKLLSVVSIRHTWCLVNETVSPAIVPARVGRQKFHPIFPDVSFLASLSFSGLAPFFASLPTASRSNCCRWSEYNQNHRRAPTRSLQMTISTSGSCSLLSSLSPAFSPTIRHRRQQQLSFKLDWYPGVKVCKDHGRIQEPCPAIRCCPKERREDHGESRGKTQNVQNFHHGAVYRSWPSEILSRSSLATESPLISGWSSVGVSRYQLQDNPGWHNLWDFRAA